MHKRDHLAQQHVLVRVESVSELCFDFVAVQFRQRVLKDIALDVLHLRSRVLDQRQGPHDFDAGLQMKRFALHKQLEQNKLDKPVVRVGLRDF